MLETNHNSLFDKAQCMLAIVFIIEQGPLSMLLTNFNDNKYLCKYLMSNLITLSCKYVICNATK